MRYIGIQNTDAVIGIHYTLYKIVLKIIIDMPTGVHEQDTYWDIGVGRYKIVFDNKIDIESRYLSTYKKVSMYNIK